LTKQQGYTLQYVTASRAAFSFVAAGLVLQSLKAMWTIRIAASVVQ
jgi:hypothetical protein